MHRFSLAVFLAVAALVGVGPANANPLDTFGYTARGMSLGGAMTAAASSYDATWYNPAGLGMLKGFELGAGVFTYRNFLKANTSARDGDSGLLVRRSEVRDAKVHVMGDVGLAAPVPLGKGLERVLFAGVSVVIPGATLYAVRERSVEQPNFTFLEDRNRRIVLNAAIAGRWKWLMVGLGFSFVPTVGGRVNVDFTDGSKQNVTEVDVGTRLSPNAGLLFEPIPGLTLGLAWRGESRLDLSIPVSAVLSGQLAPIRLKVVAVDFSTPHQVSLGVAYRTNRFLATGDVTYNVYRRFRMSAPSVLLYSSTEEGKVIQEQSVPNANLHDSWTVRVGGEVKPIKALAVRAGFSWVQSPVGAQTGDTNMLDGDRFTGSLGLGFDAEAVGGPAINLDLAMICGGLLANRDQKAKFNPDNPGYPWIGSEGWFIGSSLSAKIRF